LRDESCFFSACRYFSMAASRRLLPHKLRCLTHHGELLGEISLGCMVADNASLFSLFLSHPFFLSPNPPFSSRSVIPSPLQQLFNSFLPSSPLARPSLSRGPPSCRSLSSKKDKSKLFPFLLAFLQTRPVPSLWLHCVLREKGRLVTNRKRKNRNDYGSSPPQRPQPSNAHRRCELGGIAHSSSSSSSSLSSGAATASGSSGLNRFLLCSLSRVVVEVDPLSSERRVRFVVVAAVLE
jgi:hypothetical protein